MFIFKRNRNLVSSKLFKIIRNNFAQLHHARYQQSVAKPLKRAVRNFP